MLSVLFANTEPLAPSPASIKRNPVIHRPLPAQPVMRQLKPVCYFIHELNNALAFTGGDALDMLEKSDVGGAGAVEVTG